MPVLVDGQRDVAVDGLRLVRPRHDGPPRRFVFLTCGGGRFVTRLSPPAPLATRPVPGPPFFRRQGVRHRVAKRAFADPQLRVAGIDEEEMDRLAGGLELPGHLPGDDAANADASQQVRSFGLDGPQRVIRRRGRGLDPTRGGCLRRHGRIARERVERQLGVGFARQLGQPVELGPVRAAAGDGEDFPWR